MRTIKFRGKRVSDGEWVYGFYYELMGSNGERIPVIDESKRFDHDGDSISVYRVSPETVGQFTGLLDKDGKEIYEGDLLRFINHYEKGVAYYVYHVVLWSHKFHMWYCFHSKNKKEEGIQGNCFLHAYTQASPAFELYGNIHDNPELL